LNVQTYNSIVFPSCVLTITNEKIRDTGSKVEVQVYRSNWVPMPESMKKNLFIFQALIR